MCDLVTVTQWEKGGEGKRGNNIRYGRERKEAKKVKNMNGNNQHQRDGRWGGGSQPCAGKSGTESKVP